MFELTGFQRDLLYVISDRDRPSGQELKEEITAYVGDVNHGRLYPNLDTLVNHGLVIKGQHNRRTNYYHISEQGSQLIRNRRRWENRQLATENEFVR